MNARLLVPRDAARRSLSIPLEPAPDTALLFPSAGAGDLRALPPEEHPRGLVVLDGTWSQARALYRENPWLHALPHLALSPDAPSRYRIRRAPRRDYVSTIEATVAALRILEPDTPGLDGLLEVFDSMIEAQIIRGHGQPRHPPEQPSGGTRARVPARFHGQKCS
jgi:DTW domain-containing protein YfiP